MNKKKQLLILVIQLISYLYCSKINAAIVEVQALSFGEFAIATNNAESTLRIPYTGSTPRATYKLYPLVRGQPGHYQLTNLPAFTPLMINIADFELGIGGTEPLKIEDFTFQPVTTDINGQALLKIGATLKTTGNGNIYGDGNYNGTLNIDISW